MAEKTQANIGFEKQIWDAACVLWGHIPAAEYRKVIIGLIFLRYVSAAFESRYCYAANWDLQRLHFNIDSLGDLIVQYAT